MNGWKQTSVYARIYGGRKSVTDQWTKGEAMIDLRESGRSENKFVLETYDMPRRSDNIKEYFKTRSQGLRKARELMRRN